MQTQPTIVYSLESMVRVNRHRTGDATDHVDDAGEEHIDACASGSQSREPVLDSAGESWTKITPTHAAESARVAPPADVQLSSWCNCVACYTRLKARSADNCMASAQAAAAGSVVRSRGKGCLKARAGQQCLA